MTVYRITQKPISLYEFVIVSDQSNLGILWFPFGCSCVDSQVPSYYSATSPHRCCFRTRSELCLSIYCLSLHVMPPGCNVAVIWPCRGCIFYAFGKVVLALLQLDIA